MKVERMDHVGINVQDLAKAKAFFLDLGLEVQGEMDMEGENAAFAGRIIGLKGVKDRIVMMGIPGGPTAIELVKFDSPVDENGPQRSAPNTLGLRHLCFAVEDVEALVATLKKNHGAELMGTLETYAGVYKLCYVRGPEGIIVELAQKVG